MIFIHTEKNWEIELTWYSYSDGENIPKYGEKNEDSNLLKQEGWRTLGIAADAHCQLTLAELPSLRQSCSFLPCAC